jgi:peptidoglycan L-alanyl-D-glutamate endopeptidase CwlK
MPHLSPSSLKYLAECHPDLQKVAKECIKTFDFRVICGHRGKAEQDRVVREGKSKAKWPTSKHNSKPSRAFDAVPEPVDWKNIERFRTMADHMKLAAKRVGVKITWGGDFKTFFDGPHFEL